MSCANSYSPQACRFRKNLPAGARGLAPRPAGLSGRANPVARHHDGRQIPGHDLIHRLGGNHLDIAFTIFGQLAFIDLDAQSGLRGNNQRPVFHGDHGPAQIFFQQILAAHFTPQIDRRA